MILSFHKIGPGYFLLAKDWINRVYLQMRYLECAFIVARTAANEQTRTFAHQTVDLITLAWEDPACRHLASDSRFVLWLAKINCTHIWGNAYFEPEREITT